MARLGSPCVGAPSGDVNVGRLGNSHAVVSVTQPASNLRGCLPDGRLASRILAKIAALRARRLGSRPNESTALRTPACA
jgi:hypothetical protein